MKNLLYTCLIYSLLLFASCQSERQSDETHRIDLLNEQAFDYRYKDIDLSKQKAREALSLIEQTAPGYYDGKAKAWNTLAYAHFLTSYFDSAKQYIDTIRSISVDYNNKEIEETISYITEARLLLRDCRYADAFITYDSTITIFNRGINSLKYNDLLPLKQYDKKRYHWAKSDYLLGNAVLDFYYRNSDLQTVLSTLDEVQQNKSLHVDTTQLSVLYYTYAGSYERSIESDVHNLYNSLEYVRKGFDLLANPLTRNDYQLANNYQMLFEILSNPHTLKWMQGKDSLEIEKQLADIKENYLVSLYEWNKEATQSDSFPLYLLKETDRLFHKYEDPYQDMASNLFIATYYLEQKDTVSGKEHLDICLMYDAGLTARKGYARVWRKQLYNTLLNSLTEEDTVEEAKKWYELYVEETKVITENTKEDYNAQKGRIEAEAKAKRSLFVVIIFIIICIASFVFLYISINKNKKLKKARANLKARNEELEESRKDLELLSKIGKKIVSTLQIDDDNKKKEFVDEIYSQVRDLEVLSGLPDLRFVLYIKNGGNHLYGYAKKAVESTVKVNVYELSQTENPAVGCFLFYDRELLYFDSRQKAQDAYSRKTGISIVDEDSDVCFSSSAYLNLYNKKGDKIGVLSFQTTQEGAFAKPFIHAIFEIIGEYIAAALDNAMQYEELHFIQQKLIEQKRMELLTYVVRGVSHELSQPLGSITQTLFETFKDIDKLKTEGQVLDGEEYAFIVDNIKSDLVTISQSKDTISDLVTSFRNMIKENIVDPEVDFNLKLRLEDIVKVLKPNIKSNIQLSVECDESIVIRSFPLLFGQVITNLISNSNQHAFPDSDSTDNSIKIQCQVAGRDLIIKCIDNGVGIPDGELEKLCQPFVSKSSANLGLGLSLIKNIVEQYMRGEIRFSSDNGLVVTVMIPNCIVKDE